MAVPGSSSYDDDTSPLVGTGDANHAEDEVPNYHGISWGKMSSFQEFSERLSHHLGQIGYLGSISIAVNSLTGPAMLHLPDTYQRAGFIPTTFTLIFVAILSALCCLHMSNTISKVDGNSNYKKEVEYSETFEKFWGHKHFLFTQVLFFCCVTCLNVSSIVDTAQVVDTVLGHLVKDGSAALNIYWDYRLRIDFVRWDYSLCPEELITSGECHPFYEDQGLLFTLGYAITFIVFFPMALMDLKENAAWQILGFVVLLLSSIAFLFLFLSEGIHVEYLSLWGESWNSLFGVILFNYALVIAVPAWLYEKEPSVKVGTVVNGASILSTILYVLIGGLGAMTIPHASQNMLNSMMSGAFGLTMQICASIFAFFIIGLGCPLFSVLTRMNLSGRGAMSIPMANSLAVYLPFTMSWLFYSGDAITQLLSWGGMLFTTLVAFILPLLIALHTIEETDAEGSVSVYGRWESKIASKSAQKKALYVLLFLSCLASLAALVGNIIN